MRVVYFVLSFVLRKGFLSNSSLRPKTRVDFTFALDNNNNNDNHNNPHLNFFKGTVLGAKEQGLGIRDKR